MMIVFILFVHTERCSHSQSQSASYFSAVKIHVTTDDSQLCNGAVTLNHSHSQHAFEPYSGASLYHRNERNNHKSKYCWNEFRMCVRVRFRFALHIRFEFSIFQFRNCGWCCGCCYCYCIQRSATSEEGENAIIVKCMNNMGKSCSFYIIIIIQNRSFFFIFGFFAAPSHCCFCFRCCCCCSFRIALGEPVPWVQSARFDF